jgi:hypothetical protein
VPAGLVVPGRSWVAEQLSLTAVPAETEWPDDLLNTYVTAPEYLGPIADALGVSVDPRWWIWAILREHPLWFEEFSNIPPRDRRRGFRR